MAKFTKELKSNETTGVRKAVKKVLAGKGPKSLK
jgi:hypothetical protein